MNKRTALKVVADHIDLAPILMVKNDDATYSVYADCCAGLVEITPNYK